MEVYAITQNPLWACPGMLLYVKDGRIVAQQSNPKNDMTLEWAEDGEDFGDWVPSQYAAYYKVK